MPCDGKITKVNDVLEDEPQQISIGAEDEGWLMEFEFEDASQMDSLLEEKAYLEYLETLDDEH